MSSWVILAASVFKMYEKPNSQTPLKSENPTNATAAGVCNDILGYYDKW